jgi:uncharacterized delta-60 repeat protein
MSRQGGLRGFVIAVAIATVGWAASAPGAIAAPGDLDPTFGKNGIVQTDVDQLDGARDLAVAEDGSFYVAGGAGSYDVAGLADLLLLHYKRSGKLDTSFSHDGIARVDLNGGDESGYAVAIQPDGKVLIAGSRFVGTSGQRFVLARLKPNGKLDHHFSGDGKLLLNLGGTNQTAEDLAMGPNGKILVAGYAGPSSDVQMVVLRLTPKGKLDTTFSGDGKILTHVPGGDGVDDGAYAVARDGKKIVVGGYSGSGPSYTDYDWAVARFDSAGVPDPTFSGDGFATASLSAGPDDYEQAYALVVDSSHRPLLVGEVDVGNDVEWGLARFRTNGKLDPTFNATGPQPGTERELVSDNGGVLLDVVLDGAGRIVASGDASSNATSDDFAIGRFLQNGGLDPAFSPSETPGVELTDIKGATSDSASAVGLQPSGKIVAAGRHSFISGGDPRSNVALARYKGG